MKNYKYIIIIFGVLFMTYSCSETQKEQAPKEHAHDNNEDIALNNGEKWVVDTEMMQHIEKIVNDVQGFNIENSDYAELANKIDKNLGLLTSNCTMKGQAHDELHKWLLPFIQLSKDFKNANSNDEAQKEYEKIKESFTTFNTYFK